MDFSTLASRLKSTREKHGLTQVQLAEKSKVKQSFIGALEAGNQKSSSWLPEIANALEIDAFWLKTGKGKMPAIFLKEADKNDLNLLRQARAEYNNFPTNELHKELMEIAIKINNNGLHRLIERANQLATEHPIESRKTAQS